MRTKLVFALAAVFFLAACKPANRARPCDSALLIDHVIVDVPVEQGGTLMPGTHFTKAWQVENSGICDWTLDYSLVQVSGPDLGIEKRIQLQAVVAAGDSIQFSLRLTAPMEAGSYTAGWMIQNAAGQQFGTGPESDRPLSAEFEIPQLPDSVVYDFTQSVCLARWDSNRATFLTCEGEDDDQGLVDGYVRVNEHPGLEGSTKDNPAVIEVKPNNQEGGWIAGFFPPITIESGDRFVATIGCMDKNPGCKVVFALDYQLPDGTRGTLAEWSERYDELTTDVSVDLSDLAGKEVTLILVVRENGGASLEAKAFWLNARVERAK